MFDKPNGNKMISKCKGYVWEEYIAKMINKISDNGSTKLKDLCKE